jgi:hypothetical protein
MEEAISLFTYVSVSQMTMFIPNWVTTWIEWWKKKRKINKSQWINFRKKYERFNLNFKSSSLFVFNFISFFVSSSSSTNEEKNVWNASLHFQERRVQFEGNLKTQFTNWSPFLWSKKKVLQIIKRRSF